MFGSIRYNEFEACKLPQKAASAWSAAGNYKPVLYVGTQITRGTNYIFLAERAKPRNLVEVVVNEFEGGYEVVSEEVIV